jgi:hypothetical protein
MIMPCMNSTSFCDRGGSFAVVEGGSFLLGWPGAPGCTTTGGGGCCARARERKKSTGAPAARSKPLAKANARVDKNLRLRDKPWRRQFGTLLSILIQESEERL